MSSVESALEIARMQIEEAEATARIRNAYTNIIVQQAQSLYQIFDDTNRRKMLQRALKDKDTDASMLFRGLIMQIISVFENFIRSLCVIIVEKKSADAGRYYALDEKIREEHIWHSAKILTYLKGGDVKGIKYDFEGLQISLANCILDTNDFNVRPDVFTLLMGNCTSSRLVELFESLSLSGPFDDSLGEHLELKRCTNERSKRKVAKFAESTLNDHIALRNDIAHGNLTRSVSSSQNQLSTQSSNIVQLFLKH